MKFIYLILLFIPVNLSALEFEINSSLIKIDQDLFGNIKFDMYALGTGLTTWHNSGFGFEFLYAKSNNAKNSVELDKKYKNKIDYLFKTQLLYKYEFNKFSLITGIGYTSYKTTWSVNGSSDFYWVNDTDSDISYSLSVRHELSDNSAVQLGYDHFYSKSKPDYGDEKTTGLGISYIFKF